MKSRTKYRAIKTNGYASRKEARRAAELKLLEKAGEITNLREQVKFELIPAQYERGKCIERACNYIADFTYEHPKWPGMLYVIDVKGVETPVFKIKRKLMLFIHKIKVLES